MLRPTILKLRELSQKFTMPCDNIRNASIIKKICELDNKYLITDKVSQTIQPNISQFVESLLPNITDLEKLRMTGYCYELPKGKWKASIPTKMPYDYSFFEVMCHIKVYGNQYNIMSNVDYKMLEYKLFSFAKLEYVGDALYAIKVIRIHSPGFLAKMKRTFRPLSKRIIDELNSTPKIYDLLYILREVSELNAEGNELTTFLKGFPFAKKYPSIKPPDINYYRYMFSLNRIGLDDAKFMESQLDSMANHFTGCADPYIIQYYYQFMKAIHTQHEKINKIFMPIFLLRKKDLLSLISTDKNCAYMLYNALQYLKNINKFDAAVWGPFDDILKNIQFSNTVNKSYYQDRFRDLLEYMNITYTEEYIYNNNYFDFFLPKYNLLLDVHGTVHYK